MTTKKTTKNETVLKKAAKKKGKAGRKKLPVDTIPRVSDSMKSASAMWGIALSEIKRAKHTGCNAFVGSKVYRDRLLVWLQENPPKEASKGDADDPIDSATSEELDRRKLVAQVKRLDVGIQSDKFKLDVIKEKYIERDLVKEEWTRLWAIIEDEAKGLMDKAVFPVFVARVKAKIK